MRVKIVVEGSRTGLLRGRPRLVTALVSSSVSSPSVASVWRLPNENQDFVEEKFQFELKLEI